MSGSTIPLSLAAVSLVFLKTKCTQRLQSFPSSLYACKYILFSLSSLLSSYLLPCKAILLVAARQGAYLTVAQELITASYFPAAFTYLKIHYFSAQPFSLSTGPTTQLFTPHHRPCFQTSNHCLHSFLCSPRWPVSFMKRVAPNRI